MAPGKPGRPPKEWQNQIPLSFFDDAAVCELPATERLFLLGLIGKADRSGRGSAKASKLRVDLLDGLPIADQQVCELLAEMPGRLGGSRYQFVTYEVDRNLYYHFPRWPEFTTADYVPVSRFPAPLGAVEPSSPPPNGNADLPAGSQTGVSPPEKGEQGAVPGGQVADPHAPIRQTPEYREFEELCRAAELDHWLTEANFLALYSQVVSVRGRSWTVLHEVVNEASLSANRTPGVKYGLKIITNLPSEIRTREEARVHFAAGHNGSKQLAGSDEEDPRERLRRERGERSAHASVQ